MSDSVSTQLGSYAGYISLAIAIGGMVIGAVNHRRIRSSCCGKEQSISLDIEATSPPKDAKNVVAESRPSVAVA